MKGVSAQLAAKSSALKSDSRGIAFAGGIPLVYGWRGVQAHRKGRYRTSENIFSHGIWVKESF